MIHVLFQEALVDDLFPARKLILRIRLHFLLSSLRSRVRYAKDATVAPAHWLADQAEHPSAPPCGNRQQARSLQARVNIALQPRPSRYGQDVPMLPYFAAAMAEACSAKNA